MDALDWYRRIAPSYDAICAPLYRAARRDAVRGLRLRPGARVLDLCCGTGLALPALADAVGGDGQVVGIDGSPQMLARARRRCAGRPQIRLVEGGVRDLAGCLAAGGAGTAPFDALLIGLALTVVDDWREVFAEAWGRLRVGGRCAIYDTRPLQRGWRFLNPLFVPVVGWTGHADLRRPTWTLLDGIAVDLQRDDRLGGFVHMVAGSRPDADR